jgi:hypothetical protein
MVGWIHKLHDAVFNYSIWYSLQTKENILQYICLLSTNFRKRLHKCMNLPRVLNHQENSKVFLSFKQD